MIKGRCLSATPSLRVRLALAMHALRAVRPLRPGLARATGGPAKADAGGHVAGPVAPDNPMRLTKG